MPNFFQRQLSNLRKIAFTTPAPTISAAVGAMGGFCGSLLYAEQEKECQIGMYEIANAPSYNCTTAGDSCHGLLPIAAHDISVICQTTKNVTYLLGNATNYVNDLNFSHATRTILLSLPISCFVGGFTLGVLGVVFYRYYKQSVANSLAAAATANDIALDTMEYRLLDDLLDSHLHSLQQASTASTSTETKAEPVTIADESAVTEEKAVEEKKVEYMLARQPSLAHTLLRNTFEAQLIQATAPEVEVLDYQQTARTSGNATIATNTPFSFHRPPVRNTFEEEKTSRTAKEKGIEVHTYKKTERRRTGRH